MLEDILQALHDVPGVQATMVIDAGGKILAHRSHSIYDGELLGQVAHSIVGATDSVQVAHDDWEFVTASYSEGKVLIRNLRPAGRQPRTVMLAVIADSQLNRSFAGVAIRVAASKLKIELESPSAAPAAAPAPAPPVRATSSLPVAPVPHASGPAPTSGRGAPPASASLPMRGDVAGSGLSWSVSVTGSGASGASAVSVADPESSAYLTTCTKALSACLGPMAKVFVKEAVRKVCADRPFARDDGPALVAELCRSVEDADDRKQFQTRMKSA